MFTETADDRWHNMINPLFRAEAALIPAAAALPALLAQNAPEDTRALVARLDYRPAATDDEYFERFEKLSARLSYIDARTLASLGISAEDLSALRAESRTWLMSAAETLAGILEGSARVSALGAMFTTGAGPRARVRVRDTLLPVLVTWDSTIIEEGGRITLALHATDDAVCANRAALSSVWSNFIDNALRITTDAKIAPHFTIITSNTSEHVIVEFRDNGPGIPPEILARVFELGVSTRAGGGRGLHYVRQVLTDVGGTVTVLSQPGDTRFIVNIPRA